MIKRLKVYANVNYIAELSKNGKKIGH